jgi:aryl-alcohol dehydrogenase-like predicted oxidoreductase
MEKLAFGPTGHESTRVVFGGAALARADQDTADSVLEVLLRYGVNHLDTAAAYGDSELRIAPWLVGRGDEFFLATKTGERTGPAARAQLEKSLERLGVDHVDLIQMHNLVEEDEWEVAHGPGGALEALVAARDEGLVRHIGVTGHGLRIAGMHLRSLERFEYASVLFPYNHVLMADPGYRSDAERLIELAGERGVALQTIKGIARRRWAPDGPRDRRSWYEPIVDGDALARAVHFVLGRPGLFLLTSSDYRRLPDILEAASRPAPPPDEAELSGDEQRLGITPLFDGADLERI